MTKHDFVALETALWAATVRNTNDPPDDPETWWETRYVVAIEKALVQDDVSELTALLKARRPVHPMLLPALADALAARGRNKASGIKRKLTDTQELNVARQVQYLRLKGSTADSAFDEVATTFELSESTVKRAYLKHIPLYLRPVHIRRRL